MITASNDSLGISPVVNLFRESQGGGIGQIDPTNSL